MAHIKYISLFLAAAVILSHNTAQGFKCYSCMQCNDPFVATGVATAECSTVCLKTKVGTGVIRACSPISMKATCETSGDNAVCACDGDRCNGVTKVTVSIATVLLAVFTKLF